MSKTHWKKLNNPDYLGAYALDPGKDLIVTIACVKKELVTGPDGKEEECSVMHFKESVKPMVLNATNAKAVEKLYKSPYVEDWAEKKIQLYSTTVKAFGSETEALRVRPFIPEQESYQCDECSSNITAAYGMTPKQIVQRNLKKYGKALCADCATKAKEAAEASKKEGDVLLEDNES